MRALRAQGCERKKGPDAGDSFEFPLVELVELDTRSDDEVPDGAGKQDLTRTSERTNARSNVHAETAEIVVAHLALAGVHTYSNVEPQCVRCRDDRLAATNGPGRAVK